MRSDREVVATVGEFVKREPVCQSFLCGLCASVFQKLPNPCVGIWQCPMDFETQRHRGAEATEEKEEIRFVKS